MPFGKYKGTNMRFIDSDYLEWIVEKWDYLDLVNAAKKELQRKVDAGIIPFIKKKK